MAHPRAIFPAAAVTEYLAGGSLKNMAADYRADAVTLRRWLVDQGVAIRGQGVKVRLTRQVEYVHTQSTAALAGR